MLDICHSQGEILDAKISSNKSFWELLARTMSSRKQYSLWDAKITRADLVKYLGSNVFSHKQVNLYIYPFLQRFCASVNAVIAHTEFVNDDVKLRLFESVSLPLLTDGLSVLSNSQLNKLNSARTNEYRLQTTD